jgi:hypothetical protein
MGALRAISEKFMCDLKGGLLHPIVQQIRHDDTLMLALRGSYINVYYRGGNILKLTRDERSGKYDADFDKDYLQGGKWLDLPAQLATNTDVSAWLNQFPYLKGAMDHHFSTNNHAEREFQQLVAWENNRSPISNETEYFITDIEFADRELKTRIDMLGVRWLSDERQTESALIPVLIEMKYGNEAFEGSSGLLEHLKKIAALLKIKTKHDFICETIESQFHQLRELQLIDYRQSHRFPKPLLSAAKPLPQVVFLLANCNPRSSRLKKILSELKELEEDHSHFDLWFFVATFSGYGMHHSLYAGHPRIFGSCGQISDEETGEMRRR